MQNELLVVLVDSDLVGQWLVLVSSHNSVPDAVWIGVNDMDELWLIDAGRLKRVLQNFERHLIEAGLPKRAEVVKSIIKGLKLQPKIDAVPVVRCKNCKHYCSFYNECSEDHNHYTEEGFREVHDDDFCSYGERKTDERKVD